jgi:hypothetical protein
MMMTEFVSPFIEIDFDGSLSEQQERGSSFECAQQQGALETCLSENACEDGYCDVITLSTTTMAFDCSASLAWTCVLSQCSACTTEITNLLVLLHTFDATIESGLQFRMTVRLELESLA